MAAMLQFAEPQQPTQNYLLSRLPRGDYRQLLPHLQYVAFNLGDIVYDFAEHQHHVYFPTSCVVSLLYTTEDGSTAEVGLTGNDGVIGVAALLGGETTTNRAVVQVAGGAFKINAILAREEFARGGFFQGLVLRYTQALMTQISQTAVCNRLHSMEKRLCRWLLLSHDRVRSEELLMTQEFISNMLGGRRESVTVAAARLQDAGLIYYARGHIRILDRKGLETSACECYRIVKSEVERLFVGLASREGGKLVQKAANHAS
jgi:CRP-like cAMP-binding protein